MKKKNGNSKKKIENLVFILILLIITVVAINFIWKDDNEKQDKTDVKNNTKLVKEENIEKGNYTLEEKLEGILENINGVR